MTVPIPRYGKMAQDIVLSLKPMAGHLLQVIVCQINHHTNRLERSLNALAGDSHMSKDSVIKYTALLEAAGHIKVRRKPGGKHDDVNIYSLCGLAAEVAFYRPVETTDSTGRRNRQHRSEKSTAQVGEIDTDNIRLRSEEEELNIKSNNSFDSDSGEYEILAEGTDGTLPESDSVIRRIEAMGITGAALEAANLYPDRIDAALNIAAKKTGIRDLPGYISRILINGVYEDKTPDKVGDNLSSETQQKQGLFAGKTWADLASEADWYCDKTQDKLPDKIESQKDYESRCQQNDQGRHWLATWYQLELQLDRASFDTWLKTARFIGVEDGVYIIQVENNYARDMLQHRLYRNVKRVLSDCIGTQTEIRFVLTSEVNTS